VTKLPLFNKPLSAEATTSFTLPSDYYLDDEIFELEKRRIFYRTWQYVSHEILLPNIGDYTTLKLFDENIFVIRSKDGELRAFYNVCRHRAHELLKGSGSIRKRIVCPYHAWSYDSDGCLMSARMADNRPGFDKADFGLKQIRLEVFCGCVFINLDNNCKSLSSMTGGLEEDIRKHVPYMDNLKSCGSNLLGETYMEAGWKVVVDNYVECYHCRPAHHDFASIINMDAYEVDIEGIWSKQYGGDIRLDNTAYPVSADTGVQYSIFWYLWPNTTFNVLPGSNEFHIFSVQPKDVQSSYFAGHSFSDSGEAFQPRTEYTQNVLAPEDISLCESVQRGLRSQSYDQGVFVVDPKKPGESEHALHHFHRMVQQALSE
jgi:phenylpropionate dioxygenase-like ring-hydroxylating dioxygenase large terminal subunit